MPEPVKKGRKKKVSVSPYISTKKKFSPDEKAKKIAELRAFIEDTEKKMEEAKESDPFWFFEPSDGTVDEDRKEFLREFLKEEDIPQRLDSQLDVLLSKASIKAAFGGNRAGKSVVGAVKSYIFATGELPMVLQGIYPKEDLRTNFNTTLRIRVVGVDHKTLLNTVIPTYKKWCPRTYLKNGKWGDSYSAEQRTLFLHKEGKPEPIALFEFMTNQQDDDSFQGPDVHLLIYDEEPKQSIHKENLLRFGTAEKLDILFCMTPTNGMTWVHDLFEKDEEDGQSIEAFKLTSVTNKKIKLDVLREIVKGLDTYDEIKMRLLGEFVSLSGLVYGRLFDKKIHVVQPFFEYLGPQSKAEYLCLTGLDPHTVTPTAMVFMLLDREGNCYVDRCYSREADTEQLKADWHDIVKTNGYRTGWAVADKSSDSSIIAFGGRNIFKELKTGKNAIPALRTSEKFEGSIRAGVDEIKKRLKVNPKPSFYIVDRPENKGLIHSMRTLERDTYADEEKNGMKDRIKEGKHHFHSSMRYLFQYPLVWYAAIDNVPVPTFEDEAVCW